MKKIIRKFKASKSWLSVLEQLQAIPKDKFKPLEANYMTSDSSVYVDDSFIHGKGLFAKYFIPSGAVIGLVQGQPTTEDGDYVLWTDETNGIHVHCDLRYINHSDDPNAVYYDNLEVCAMRDIQAGEEITHNYGAGWEE
jgi:SET domain-containing protein